MHKEDLIKEIELCESALKLARAGRAIYLEQARTANNSEVAFRYIRASTAPCDAFEYRHIERLKIANKKMIELLTKEGENGKSS